MKHLLILAMTLLAVSTYGQTELPTGRIEVVKDFEVRLTETKKIRRKGMNRDGKWTRV